MEKIYLTAKEIAERTGKSVKNIHARMEHYKVAGRWINKEKRFPVTEDYLAGLSDADSDCVTVKQLTERTHLAEQTVRKRLHMHGIVPVLVGMSGTLYYNDQEGLDELLKQVPPSDFHPQLKRQYEEEIPPEVRAQLNEAEEKKKWIGKKGKIVDGTRVVFEGTIESVSICGVIVAGHIGCLKDLQLA
jgi:hypothetical protein